jgi:Sulfotransferase family
VEGHQLVFLGGLHRSGTTLLARLLAAHPSVSGFSGTGAPADEGQHLQSVYPPAKVYGGPGRFGFAPEAHLTEESPLATEASARRLFADWSGYWDLEKPVLLEKSPPNLLKTRFLQALFPSAAFVVVFRHPIPVTLATARWRETRRLQPLLEHWLHCYELFEEDRRSLRRVHVIRYEDLVEDPDGALARVWGFLGLEPGGVSEPVEPGSNEAYFERWRALKHDLRIRAYLTVSSLRLERRFHRFGYSLLRPGRDSSAGARS